MTNQKSLDKKKTSELFEGVGSSLHQAFIGAVERDKEPKKISACCNAEVATANSGLAGETNYYICTKCHNDCDVIAEPKELEWIKDWKQLNPNWTEVQISFIGSLLQDLEEEIRVQQRTELLEEIKRIINTYWKTIPKDELEEKIKKL
jgi:hypothetical protein